LDAGIRVPFNAHTEQMSLILSENAEGDLRKLGDILIRAPFTIFAKQEIINADILELMVYIFVLRLISNNYFHTIFTRSLPYLPSI